MLRRLFTLGLALPACGSVVDFPNVDGSTGSSAESSSGPDAATSAAPDPTSSPVPTTSSPTTGPDPTTSASTEGSSESDGCDFLDCDDTDSPPDVGCDIWEQNCAEGEKCTAYANDGGAAWNDTRCVPIVDDPGGLYEPCTVEESGVSGIDTCDLGLMCWNVTEELTGTCQGLCQGSRQDPTCEDESAVCAVSGDATLPLCLSRCDPLDPDTCARNEGCYPTGYGLLCIPDASGRLGGAFDQCEYVNACDPGLSCVGADVVPGCESNSCCTPFCDLADPVCPEMTTCVPFFEPGQVPDGFESELGLCAAEPA
ncbi:MAG: hypothetical protein ACE37F_29990 [Nannocystaceae bacterium]|nr:hypothetical protein [bacterium]